MVPLNALSKALSLPGLGDIPNDEVFTRREEIIAEVRGAICKHPTDYWLGVLKTNELWHAEVQDYERVINDPQVIHNGSIQTMAGTTGTPISLVMHPVKYNGKTPSVRIVPQPLGAQTREILSELGFDNDQICDFEAREVIKSNDQGFLAD